MAQAPGQTQTYSKVAHFSDSQTTTKQYAQSTEAENEHCLYFVAPQCRYMPMEPISILASKHTAAQCI